MSKAKQLEQSYGILRKKIEEFHRQSASSEKKTAILFADLAGSTVYKSQRDLISSLLKVYRHNEEIRTQVRKFNGEVVKWLGDGVMATFSIDESDDIALPLQAIIIIQKHFENTNKHVREDERILSRIGISCGNVVDFSSVNPSGADVPDPQGPIVDLAARLCSLARTRQILCDDTVVRLVSESGRSFNLSKPSMRNLKGFPKPSGS